MVRYTVAAESALAVLQQLLTACQAGQTAQNPAVVKASGKARLLSLLCQISSVYDHVLLLLMFVRSFVGGVQDGMSTAVLMLCAGAAIAGVMLSSGLLPPLEQLFRQVPGVSPAHVAAASLLVSHK